MSVFCTANIGSGGRGGEGRGEKGRGHIVGWFAYVSMLPVMEASLLSVMFVLYTVQLPSGKDVCRIIDASYWISSRKYFT